MNFLRVTMWHMERTTARELHLRTSALLKNVAEGATYVIEFRGKPIAELRPVTERKRGRPLPDREAFIQSLPQSKTDSGRILEEDRT
jgi:antitoxin (DNA-binding transcriptional repressor) of toxin-antitoxin stability system